MRGGEKQMKRPRTWRRLMAAVLLVWGCGSGDGAHDATGGDGEPSTATTTPDPEHDRGAAGSGATGAVEERADEEHGEAEASQQGAAMPAPQLDASREGAQDAPAQDTGAEQEEDAPAQAETDTGACEGSGCESSADPPDEGAAVEVVVPEATTVVANYEWLWRPITMTQTLTLMEFSASLSSVEHEDLALIMRLYTQRLDADTGRPQPDRDVTGTVITKAQAGELRLASILHPLLEAGETYWVGIRIIDGEPDAVGAPVAELAAREAPERTYVRYQPPVTYPPTFDPWPPVQTTLGLDLALSVHGEPVP
ncbi:MAG: hypothetical protein PVI30_08520 [Myxococcales bacterium]|jgi:hypothetical protein